MEVSKPASFPKICSEDERHRAEGREEREDHGRDQVERRDQGAQQDHQDHEDHQQDERREQLQVVLGRLE